MENLYVILPNKNISLALKNMVNSATKDIPHVLVNDINNLPDLNFKKLLFVAQVENVGYDIPMINLLDKLLEINKNPLNGSVGALLLYSTSDHGTKRFAQDVIYAANNMGCSFPGHPLIEAISSFRNFLTWQKTMNMGLEDICYTLSHNLVEKLMSYNPKVINSGKIAVIYSSPHKTSNTLDLWHMVSKHISNFEIKELQVESGKVLDCVGCPYKLCLHYGKKKGCFYGGIMTENILPAIEESDAVVFLCPNYNDAIAANLTAVINRLTALYRRSNFNSKSIFAVIVSGNSSSDSVAKQLIGALNLNKGFRLPPHFSIDAIANDPKTVFTVDGIEIKSELFSKAILENIRI